MRYGKSHYSFLNKVRLHTLLSLSQVKTKNCSVFFYYRENKVVRFTSTVGEETEKLSRRKERLNRCREVKKSSWRKTLRVSTAADDSRT